MSRIAAMMRMIDFFRDSGDVGVRALLDNEYRYLMKEFIVQGEAV